MFCLSLICLGKCYIMSNEEVEKYLPQENQEPVHANDDVKDADKPALETKQSFGGLLSEFKDNYVERTPEEFSIEEYLELCATDPNAYKTPAERLLEAIGKPDVIDTSRDARLSRIFDNRKINVYPAFKDLFGMEDTIEDIVSFLKHSSQGLEESKQILYLLGPVGSAKSSIAERLKELMEKCSFYAIKESPINESPLGLFHLVRDSKILESANIPPAAIKHIMSPWAVKRLKEFHGDITKFKVVKRFPSNLEEIGISKTEPGDENNQDISSLVGKVDIRMLEQFSQADTDAYSYSGGLAKGHRGLMEFVEMFKAPIKMLHPLLTATQERNYKGTEPIGAIPFDGIIVAHSNESEWKKFVTNKNNEAFIDRINIVKVPYCLRISDEVKIYKKLIEGSTLNDAPYAPETLEILAKFAVLTRLQEHENSNLFAKMRVYDGQNLKDTEPNAKELREYKEKANNDEGMSGFSTRASFKVLSATFNANSKIEIAADPIHLMHVLRKKICKMDLDEATKEKYLNFIEEYLKPEYVKTIGKQIQAAYVESYSEYGQNIFDRYIDYADLWIQDKEHRDAETGQVLDREALDEELSKIEKPAGIGNTKDFRNEVVNYVLRHRASHEGANPNWTGYEKLKDVIEKKVFENSEELLPVIASDAKRSAEDQRKHNDFVERMTQRGYTPTQVQLVSDYYKRETPRLKSSGPS